MKYRQYISRPLVVVKVVVIHQRITLFLDHPTIPHAAPDFDPDCKIYLEPQSHIQTVVDIDYD